MSGPVRAGVVLAFLTTLGSGLGAVLQQPKSDKTTSPEAENRKTETRKTETTDAARRARQRELFGETLLERARRERQAELFSKKTESAASESAPAASASAAAEAAVAKPPPPSTPSTPADESRRRVVFVIPGTWANAGSWFLELPGQATFRSELQATLGAETVVHHWNWPSANEHDVRDQGADHLAEVIREKTKPSDRIVLVGHSHGGNLALRASERCGRKIETVICISTPSLYYRMQDTVDGKPRLLDLPVYCTPDAYRNIGRIVTITPQTDNVVDNFASWWTGIAESDAHHATRAWCADSKTIRLRDDGSPLEEAIGKVIPAKFPNNVFVSAHLNVAHLNIVYPSRVPNEPLLSPRSHQAGHSRRMGSVIGQLVRDNFDAKSVQRLQTLTQSPDADQGEPIAIADHRAQQASRIADYEHSGWLLVDAVVTSDCDWDREKHWSIVGGLDPDPYFRLCIEKTGAELYCSDVQWNTKTAHWTPATSAFLPRGESCEFRVEERNIIEHPLVGFGPLTIGPHGPPAGFNGKNWTAKLKWLKVHE